MKIAVLVTCHNRVETTLSSLRQLRQALSAQSNLIVKYFIVDDGSTDGTAESLRREFPDIFLTYGDGNLFWNRGMCLAYSVAREQGPYDCFLLFNDDLLVDIEAVSSFFDDFNRVNRESQSILCAATVDSEGAISYSGLRRTSRYRPLSVERVIPSGRIQSCDTFNGNFVLIPAPFFEACGGLNPKFWHCYGDLDLGYRAVANHVPVWLAGLPIGFCEGRHPHFSSCRPTLQNFARKLRSRWQKQDSLGQRIYFIRQHSPIPFAFLLIGGAVVLRFLTVAVLKISK